MRFAWIVNPAYVALDCKSIGAEVTLTVGLNYETRRLPKPNKAWASLATLLSTPSLYTASMHKAGHPLVV